ncbi:hypothetical protein CAFE_08050 [Caprobacter fermentans]|uniref:Abasic site processing protein n=1 Tax=Caproicibacter fermentans TaxID=2576756 RepID=A0A6N8HWU0_9FIRM|nr:hypothetical protein [Caproicibacter fermentans]MVB10128.1 hypothetical protein [Caproicibacter fermentans]
MCGRYVLFSDPDLKEIRFSMQDVHDRMPIVLDGNGRNRWLEDAQSAMELLNRVPPELARVPV